MAARVHIAVASCVLLINGCLAAVQQSSSARTTSTPTTAAEEVLTVGMGLGDALEMLTRHHVEFHMDRGAWMPRDGVAAAEKFIIERRDIDDALIIYAESERGEPMRVRDVYWWRNYQADARLPKGARKWKHTRVKSLSMAEIERQFALALNPYNSDKVPVPEWKK